MFKNFTLTNEITTHKRLFGLDLMRACSIIMVFLAHSASLNPLNAYFPYFAWLGFGVEAFFVLSGFLIGRIILRTVFQPEVKWNSIKIFWMNRWLRTVPAYFFTLLIYYYFGSVTKNSLFYWFFSQNMITPIPDFFVHSWSLAVEEWFYLGFPVLLWIFTFIFQGRVPKYRIFMFGIIAFVVFGLATKTMYHVFYKNGTLAYLLDNKLIFPSWNKFLLPHGHWDDMRKIVPFRIDAIAYGCVIAYLVERFSGISKKISIYMLILGILCLSMSYWILSVTVGGSAGANFFADVFLLPLFCISFALMIPYGIVCSVPNKLIATFVTKLSITSYSFYLIHFLILDSVLENIPNTRELTTPLKWVVFVGTYFLTFLASYLMYRLIEAPFLNYRKKLADGLVYIK